MELNVYSIKNSHLCKIQVSSAATVEDIKKEVAKQKSKLYVERQSLRTELKGKDRQNSLTVTNLGLQNGSSVYVKDLGPQISWTVVFVLEYLGPPVVYALFALRPYIIYGDKGGDAYPFTLTAYIALGCWTFHYVKRLYETIFVHRFSHGTMPIRNLFKNCAYYWGFAAYVALHVNHPLFTPPSAVQVISGTAIFVVCELGNLSIHLLLRDLRPAGSTVRKIPKPNGNFLTQLFNYVSCPNYTYEYGAWLGFSILTNCIPAFVFAVAGMFQMTLWAIGKHKAYVKEFKDYPKRKAIIPFVL